MRTILRAARLVDATGAAAVADAVVVVEGERITRIGPAAALRVVPVAGVDRVIDVPGGTILPGFIESHTHIHCSGTADAYQDVLTDTDALALLRASVCLRELLSAGVTTVRDIGSKNSVAFAAREAVARGIIPGPRLLVCGAPITTTGGHFSFMELEADSVEEVIAAFRAQVKLGADHVKMMVSGGAFTPGTNTRRAQYGPAHVHAAVSEGKRLHKQLVAHCHATEAIAFAAEAGVDYIVHCSWQTEDGMAADEGAIRNIIEKGIYVDPTLAVGYHARTAMIASGSHDMDRWAEERARRLEIFREMRARGARFIVGTDSGMPETPFSSWAVTPELFVHELGFSPIEAIQAGTKVTAEALGMAAEIGTLAEGKRADITIVNGDPLADIRALGDVDTVLAGGKVMKHGGRMNV